MGVSPKTVLNLDTVPLLRWGSGCVYPLPSVPSNPSEDIILIFYLLKSFQEKANVFNFCGIKSKSI